MFWSFKNWDYVENTFPLVGEGGGVRGPCRVHPHLDPPPSRGRIILGNFMVRLAAGRHG